MLAQTVLVENSQNVVCACQQPLADCRSKAYGSLI
jgi:hypothetical protein